MRIRIWLRRGLTLWGSLLMNHESSWGGAAPSESQATSPALRAPAAAPHELRLRDVPTIVLAAPRDIASLLALLYCAG